MTCCTTCPHTCCLGEGFYGLCKSRCGRDDEVVAEGYGRITSLALDPIEKKPISCWRGGTTVLSLGSYGCNMRCPFCQNASIAQVGPDEVGWRVVSPGEIVETAAPKVYDTGVARLFRDADQLEAGVQSPNLSLWAGALDVPCAWIWEYLENPILVIEEPDRVKARCDDRLAGFQEDFKLTLERQEAVPEQMTLLRSWEESRKKNPR